MWVGNQANSSHSMYDVKLDFGVEVPLDYRRR